MPYKLYFYHLLFPYQVDRAALQIKKEVMDPEYHNLANPSNDVSITNTILL